MSRATAALDYLDRGLSVLPLLPRGKQPHAELLRQSYGDPGWKRLAEDRPLARDVEGWFTRCPEANLGIIAGAVSDGLVIVDLNVEPARPLPATPTARSWRGSHLYLRANRPVPNRDCPWGEVRAEGKYVVAPPASTREVSPTSGKSRLMVPSCSTRTPWTLPSWLVMETEQQAT